MSTWPFTERSSWHSYVFTWEKYWKVIFSWTIEGWCIIFGTEPGIWKYISVKVSEWPLTFISRSYEFTFSKDFCFVMPGPVVTIFHIMPMGLGELKFVQNGSGLLTKMAAMPKYGKNHRKSSPTEPRNMESWNLVYNICDSRPRRFPPLSKISGSISACIIFGTLTLWTKNIKIFHCEGPMNALFQTTSALKSEGQLWPYFIFNLGLGEQKLIQMITVCWPRWPPCPYRVNFL